MSRAVRLLALALVLGVVLARTSAAATAPADSVKMPAPHPYSYAWDIFDNSIVRPTTRLLDPALLVRRLSGRPREAANVDERDDVQLPSTWWQPRLGYRTISPERMRIGSGSGRGPAPGRWTVTSAKDQGVTVGFRIKDAAGVKYQVKFDPPGYADLSTSAEVIGTHLFWAAGYNVPENTIAHFYADSLDIAPDAKITDSHGRKAPMTRDYIRQLLSKVACPPDGHYRCVASRYLDGKPLEAYEYRGRRRDDPDDLIPHELRRELRGLWVLCAWTNHADSRGPNSLDMWVTEGGRSFVRHHLIDFSGILGAGPTGPRRNATGGEYYVDYGVMGRELTTLGLRPFAWERAVDPGIPAVGLVESEVFDPSGWRPDYPNPAFDARTVRDNRWGARILAGFDDELIRAAVDAAQYSDPRAADYVVRTLIHRRDKLVDRWLGAAAGR